MWHIGICDDDPTAAAYVRAQVEAWAVARGTGVRTSAFANAEQLLFAYEEQQFDLLLLDIEMKRLSGMDLARELRARDERVQIVFITGFPDYMAQGYDVAALHYLMKPVDRDRLFAVLDRAANEQKKVSPMLLLPCGEETVRVSAEDIVYVEAFAHSTAVVTARATLDCTASITRLEELCGAGFVRCHRSYLVNLRWVSRVTKTEVVLDNGMALPLSRRRYNDINRAFIAYYTEDTHGTV